MKRRTSTTILIMTLTGLAGCDSGSSRGHSNPLQTGTFGSIPVSGLHYTTESRAGTTNENGEFNYLPGESVRFFLGEQLLGEADGASRITEFDIAGLAQIPQNQLEWTAYHELRSGRSALSKAANIGGILQSLDTDANLGNNIQIDDSVSALVSEDLLDLHQPSWHLGNDRRVRKLLYRASLYAGLTPRPVRSASLALQPMLPFDTIEQYQRFEEDRDNDGTTDLIQTYEYSPMGKRAVTIFDTDADGIADRRNETIYNTNNVQVQSMTDNNNDGSFDSGWRLSLDDFGQILSRETLGPEGVVQSRRIQRWDAEGALIYRENITPTRHTIETWEFVDSILTSYESDTDGDGVIDERHTFEGVNLQSDHTHRYVDRGADGTIDSVTVRVLNSLGHVLSKSVDEDNDGTFDLVTEYQYDAIGKQLLLQTHDAEGNLTRMHTWTYGEDDLLLGAEGDSDGDGAIDWRSSFSSDENQHPLEIRYDTNGDGAYEQIGTYTTGNFGETLRYDYDNDGDGMIDYTLQNTYEGLRRVRSDIDDNGDGIIDSVHHFREWIAVPVTSFL